MKWEEWNETHMHQSQEQERHAPTHRISPLNHTPSAAYPLTNVTLTDIETGGSLEKNYAECVLRDINARVVVLSGYVCRSIHRSPENTSHKAYSKILQPSHL